jgi:predicted neutral ceramidase superfamily lipid hydrolase
MSEGTEMPLRNALDAIDGMRVRILMGGWLAVLITLGAYGRFYWVLRHSDSVGKIIDASLLALTCLIAWATFAIVLIVVRMTKKVLQAIDLSARRS